MADESQSLTFEAIDSHIKRANLGEVDTSAFTQEAVAAAPGNVIAEICRIYHVIRPILQGILLIPFIPATWKTAIKTFISVMDRLCPS